MIAMHASRPTETAQLREDMVAEQIIHAVVIEVHAEHHRITTCCVGMRLDPVVQVPGVVAGQRMYAGRRKP